MGILKNPIVRRSDSAYQPTGSPEYIETSTRCKQCGATIIKAGRCAYCGVVREPTPPRGGTAMQDD